ncbi:hypothetical protein M6B38_322015 [Iris pallida]|uniref:Uncharacterized protein n=1 Tax=Iris pallida TaxID=29817 RepID=A0AAX6HCE7_IRIPA|nr:hypothetical protein M6B38_322015 [Iris pallida]
MIGLIIGVHGALGCCLSPVIVFDTWGRVLGFLWISFSGGHPASFITRIFPEQGDELEEFCTTYYEQTEDPDLSMQEDLEVGLPSAGDIWLDIIL